MAVLYDKVGELRRLVRRRCAASAAVSDQSTEYFPQEAFCIEKVMRWSLQKNTIVKPLKCFFILEASLI